MQASQTPIMVNLGASLTVDHAAALKSEITGAIKGGDSVLLGISAAEELELSCLQVLYAAKLSAKAAGKELHIVGKLSSRIAGRLAACGFLKDASASAEDLDSALELE
jgi:anti-anti-sigma regulatory factor